MILELWFFGNVGCLADNGDDPDPECGIEICFVFAIARENSPF